MVGLFFPGQGAQAIGMGREFYERSSAAKRIFEQADSVLGFKLTDLIFNGPEEELTMTVNSQPAIFTTSLAALAALLEKIPSLTIQSACGLSLGELSALAALKVFTFEEGLRLVEKRGRFMESAATRSKGSMVSIVGMNLSQTQAVAQEAGVEVANINSPEQIVLSGDKDKIAAAAKLAESKGAKKVVILKVSGAFHSSLMQPAAEQLKAELKGVSFRPPKGLFLSNVTGNFESDPEKIKENLSQQVTGSVQWVRTMENLSQKGIKNFVELAPGKVLKGLARRTIKELEVEPLENAGDLAKIVEKQALKEKETVHAS